MANDSDMVEAQDDLMAAVSAEEPSAEDLEVHTAKSEPLNLNSFGALSQESLEM